MYFRGWKLYKMKFVVPKNRLSIIPTAMVVKY